MSDYNNCKLVQAHHTNYRVASRSESDIKLIVIHVTESSNANSPISWFAGDHGNSGPSSAHYVIDTDGTITQCVLEKDIAFAAPGANKTGIHLEHVGFTNRTIFKPEQMKASAQLTKHLLNKYGLPASRSHVMGHVEIPGNSHTDPGRTWDWKNYMELITGTYHENKYWLHKDGLIVPSKFEYEIKWPYNSHHGYILADDKWQVWHGSTLEDSNQKIKLILKQKGPRILMAFAYDNKNKLIMREDLNIVVG